VSSASQGRPTRSVSPRQGSARIYRRLVPSHAPRRSHRAG